MFEVYINITTQYN